MDVARIAGEIFGYIIIFSLLVVASVNRAKKGKKYKGLYIFSVVLAVLATLGFFAQKSAGQSQDFTDVLELVLTWVIEIIGLLALLINKNKTVTPSDNDNVPPQA